MAVTDGNMTDTDKLDLQQMLMESQKELENLRKEKENLLEQREGLLEHVKVLEDSVDAKPESADSAKAVQEKKSEAEKFRQMKKSYLKIHAQKMQLEEKVIERDTQLKVFREGFGVTPSPPVDDHDLQRSSSAGDLTSPVDPRAEVLRLRSVVKEKDERIHNLDMQLRSFQQGLADGQDQITQLRAELESTQVPN